jgi:hypothetical protein
MSIETDEVQMVKRALPEYLTMAKAGVEVGGLGFPVATLLFAVASTIGSYHEKDATLKVRVDGHDVSIIGTDDHLRILNSQYFGDPNGLGLTGNEIGRLYSLVRSRVTHNALVGEGCYLAEGEPTKPAIQQTDGLICVYLPELWNRCNEAATRFLAVADKVIPSSSVVQALREKEARQGVNYEAALKQLQSMPWGGQISVTAMGRPRT